MLEEKQELENVFSSANHRTILYKLPNNCDRDKVYYSYHRLWVYMLDKAVWTQQNISASNANYKTFVLWNFAFIFDGTVSWQERVRTRTRYAQSVTTAQHAAHKGISTKIKMFYLEI